MIVYIQTSVKYMCLHFYDIFLVKTMVLHLHFSMGLSRGGKEGDLKSYSYMVTDK